MKNAFFFIIISLVFITNSCSKSIEKNLCNTIKCSNNGECIVEDEAAICNCNEGYTANNFECLKNSCDEVTCSDHGTCTVENNIAVCNCDENFVAKDLTCIDSSLIQTNIDLIMSENKNSHEEEGDYTWHSNDEVLITLGDSSILSDGVNVSINENSATITASGTYRITGTLTDGNIIVESEDDEIVRLILDNVNINSSTTAAISIIKSKKTIIVLPESTNNTLSDAENYVYDNGEDEPNATLFSKDDLSIYGEGTLNITANYNDGITSKDGLVINSGNINVDAKDDGIRGKDYLVIENGTININSGGNALKSDEDEDLSKGYVFIKNVNLAITSQDDGIDAQTDVLISGGLIDIQTVGGSSSSISDDKSAKAIKANTELVIAGGTFNIDAADDAIHSNENIIIDDGIINIKTADDGIHADQSIIINSGFIDIKEAFEGIEAGFITFNDGEIRIIASNDTINSTIGGRGEESDGSCIYIYGGKLVLTGSEGDAIDSNGNIIMEAGTVIIHGPTKSSEVMLDYNGTFNISGGTLISSGTDSHMLQAPSSSSRQNSLKLVYSSSNTANTLFHLEDSYGNEIITFSPSNSYKSIVFSSPMLETGKSYNIYKSGTCVGNETDGVYNECDYSSGDLLSRFTVSQTVTSINK